VRRTRVGRLTAPFRQVYAEVMADLRREIQGAFIDPTGFDANVYGGLQASLKKHKHIDDDCLQERLETITHCSPRASFRSIS